MSSNVKLVRSFFPRGNKKVLMYAHLEFFDSLEVRNWRLCKSDREGGDYYVGYPNAPLGKDNKRYRQVIPRTESLQNEILKLLVRTYDAMTKTKDSAKNKRDDRYQRLNGIKEDTAKEVVTY